MTWIVSLVCTLAIEIGRVFASNSNYVVCFNKVFAGKGFCAISSLLILISCCLIFDLNKFAYLG